jgi:hypothetical protein
VTTNLRLTARQVIDYDELPTQLDVFFHALKGQRGRQDYQGTPFASYER